MEAALRAGRNHYYSVAAENPESTTKTRRDVAATKTFETQRNELQTKTFATQRKQRILGL